MITYTDLVDEILRSTTRRRRNNRSRNQSKQRAEGRGTEKSRSDRGGQRRGWQEAS